MDDNTGSSGGLTGEDSVVDNVEITGVDMHMMVNTRRPQRPLQLVHRRQDSRHRPLRRGP